jgi:NAD(P)-dependent dehydrogenase (short-subunit alcohol dehydrogenase family)
MDPSTQILKEQIAVVTGGGRGIGRAVAKTLAHAGASVAVLARSSQELHETVGLITQDGGRAQAFVADATDAAAVARAFKEIERSMGAIDVLVNNAAVLKPFGPLWENDADEWWRSVEVNVRGPMLCAQAVLPQMIARSRGRIINISSGAGAMGAPYYSSYIVSKTALIRMTECLALETAPHGLAIFAISPGTVRTAMSEYSLQSPEGQRWLPWYRRVFEEHIDVPAERPARLVLELASGKADALSGRFLTVFDDLELLLRRSAEIEEKDLYTLRLPRLTGAPGNAALASLLADAKRTVVTNK